MNFITHNGFLTLEYLSNIELFFSTSKNISDDIILVDGDEFLHVSKVMRHKLNDVLHITNGKGIIYRGKIFNINKNSLQVKIDKEFIFKNKFENIYFCIPKLKSADRFELALEKSVELGITNFLIFESERTISKSSKKDRWNKILLSAMKQSLRSFLPKLEIVESLSDILKLKGNKFIFEQNSDKKIDSLKIKASVKNFFIFGPEGGLSSNEIKLCKENDFYRLSENRLRTETAIIKCASLLTK